MNNLNSTVTKEEVDSDINLNYDDKLYLTYNLFDKTYILQCAFENDEYTELFSKQLYQTDTYGEGSQAYTIYDQENDSYFEIHKINDDIKAIIYMKSKDFDKLEKICKQSSLPFINTIRSYRAESFATSHFNIIYSAFAFNDTPENRKLAEKCKKLYTKYEMSKNAIATSYLLTNIESVLNHYIATKELNVEELLRNYMVLTDFSDFCNSSFPLISNFVYNPEDTDCRKLSEALNININNIGNLINIYLKDELDILDKKEKGD